MEHIGPTSGHYGVQTTDTGSNGNLARGGSPRSNAKLGRALRITHLYISQRRSTFFLFSEERDYTKTTG